MSKNLFPKVGKTGFMLGAALLITVTVTGCVGYVHGPRHGSAYVAHDDYVYYPGYQVYYSNTRRCYVYLEGRSWVERPAPPRVSVDVLLRAPSVSVDFHDHPSRHHTTVARQYPKQWAPPGRGNNQRPNDDQPKGNKGRD
jgi:hypothetical protein